MLVCGLTKRLLSEKLIDDFYEEGDLHSTQREPATDTLTEQLKSLLPTDAHALLLRWEAECTETCGEELRRFARFVADTMLESDGQENDCPSVMVSKA